MPGIGPLTATALAAAVNDGKQFDNGRQMAASLGLTPREHSSGGKQQLMGITKRGDTYLRTHYRSLTMAVKKTGHGGLGSPRFT